MQAGYEPLMDFGMCQQARSHFWTLACDGSNSHTILSPIFTYILRFNVQNNAKLRSVHPNLCFAGI